MGTGELGIPRFRRTRRQHHRLHRHASNSHASPSKKHREVHPYAASAPITATLPTLPQVPHVRFYWQAGRTEAEWRVVFPVTRCARQQKAAATALASLTRWSLRLVRSLWQVGRMVVRGVLIEPLTRIVCRAAPPNAAAHPHSFAPASLSYPSAESNT